MHTSHNGLSPSGVFRRITLRIEFLSSPPPPAEFTSVEPDQEFDMIQPGRTVPNFWVAMTYRIHEVV